MYRVDRTLPKSERQNMSKTDQAAPQPATQTAPEPTVEPAVEEATIAAIREAVLAPDSVAYQRETQANALAMAAIALDPPTALDRLRVKGREPLTIWKTKGPKSVGGEIAAVLCQDDNTIVLVHTLPSGKWSVFTKAVIS